MGESVSVQVSIERDSLRGKVLLEKQIQRGLQRGAEARDRTFVSMLAIATGRSIARRLRDAEGNYSGDGIVSTRTCARGNSRDLKRRGQRTKPLELSTFQRTWRRSTDAHRR